jgi:Protein of unknown function (DUF1579)
MKRALTAAALVAAALANSAAAQAQQDPAYAQLDRLLGSWRSPGTFVDSAYSKAATADATTTCAWSDGRFYLICQQTVVMGGKTTHGIAIYTYDPDTKKYRFYNVDVARANGTDISVTPTSITYSGEFTDEGKHVLTRTLNVWETPQRYTWRSEYSLDEGKTWVLMGSGVSTRTP